MKEEFVMQRMIRKLASAMSEEFVMQRMIRKLAIALSEGMSAATVHFSNESYKRYLLKIGGFYFLTNFSDAICQICSQKGAQIHK